MAKEQITITPKDFDTAYESAVEFLTGALKDAGTSMDKAMMHLMVAATISAHIKHILFREEEADNGDKEL